ncbi:Endonuclease 8 1 [Corynebacterium pelargi]|uniref:DNA-(apurinic or apyrimidinic site) lyase n=2 Tax=Corynebacterium pelargi TaxID=1471400 RepID=A0A410WBP4_9CORY|nr:Endonuclease 8 1 [Corynebacterium pelargi]
MAFSIGNMPEGHVIHRLAKELDQHFGGTIPEVSSPQGRFAIEAKALDSLAYDHAEAWGKHLFVHFAPERFEHIVHIHLGLIGSFRIEPAEEVWGQIRLRIANDAIAANLRGPQWCRLISEEEQSRATGKLGADPLREDADFAAILGKVRRSKRTVASLLMDQKLFAGVGNIYRAETLFRLGIDPFTPGERLDCWPEVWEDLRFLMAEGVQRGRIDTVREVHTPEAMGRPPRKDDHGGEVYVYRRSGQPCYVCGHPIAERSMEGRNLFWCPACQRQH